MDTTVFRANHEYFNGCCLTLGPSTWLQGEISILSFHTKNLIFCLDSLKRGEINFGQQMNCEEGGL